MDSDSIVGGPKQHWNPNVHTVVVEDVRRKEEEHTLNTAGFQFYRRPSQHTRFLEEEEVKAGYYPECMELQLSFETAFRSSISGAPFRTQPWIGH